ncbi:acyl-CoA reductase [Flavobacteriaceae bacterium Ap0902]|nr:acyl-CoA reductase [Flavobacteriaceae bacterium Ap0902]
MQKSKRIKAFSILGDNLESFINYYNQNNPNEEQREFEYTLKQAKAKNGWFTIENQLYALNAWAKILKEENLNTWLNLYELKEDVTPKKVGIIAAGNIPMVGFHDILSVLITGHIALIKLSSSDDVLIPYLLKNLTQTEPDFQNQFEIIEQLKDYDAVIATGSDNTARYFETYFKNVPHIIRKNRTSVAVIDGNESEEELKALTQDVLMHYGLGCRNVTKLLVPQNYDINHIFKVLFPWADIINHHKYANNYDYNKAIYLMKGLDFKENGFVIMKNDEGLFSPLSTIFYQEYKNKEEVESFLLDYQNQIQCVVGKDKGMIPFGKSQEPALWDYADNIDVINWLKQLN